MGDRDSGCEAGQRVPHSTLLFCQAWHPFVAGPTDPESLPMGEVHCYPDKNRKGTTSCYFNWIVVVPTHYHFCQLSAVPTHEILHPLFCGDPTFPLVNSVAGPVK